MKKILAALLLVLILIQFFPIDKTNSPINQGMDFITIKKTPENIEKLLKTSCYDCHSNETKYPWYSNIQPVGWVIKNHIKDGRKHFNFSTFATYEPKKQAHKLEESIELIENGEMPMESYILGHPEANLTKENKTLLINYLKKEKENILLTN